jgi:hypothetical protein
MKGGRRLWVPAVLSGLVLALSCWAPVTAEGEGEVDTGAAAAFRLHGTHGYEILVLATSRPGFAHGEVLVIVERGNAGTTYFAPATVTPKEIEADLGKVGRISVAFQPSGEYELARSRCENQSAVYEGGKWVGTIEFHGEEGYTEAVATDAKALLEPFLDLLCSGSSFSETSGPRLPGAALSVSSHGQPPKLSFRASANRPGARLKVEASIEERRGAVAISRSIDASFPSDSFRWDADLGTARLAPPSPFSGSAVFRRKAKPANQWTGNLKLDFPGRSSVPIAGARFSAGLRHARIEEERLHAAPKALRALRANKSSP